MHFMSIQISFLMHFTSYVFLIHFYFCSIIWWRLMAIYCLKTQSQSQSIIFTISFNQAFIGNVCVGMWRRGCIMEEGERWKKMVLPRADGVQMLSVSMNTHYMDSYWACLWIHVTSVWVNFVRFVWVNFF